MSIFDQNFKLDEIFEFGSLKASTKSQLSEVYKLLAGLFASCSVGTYLNIVLGYGGRATGFMGFMCMIYVFCAREKSMGRLLALLGFGLLEGMSLGGLVQLSLLMDPRILVTALLSTLGIFVSFSLAALWSDRRHALYLYGFLGTFINIIFLFSIMSLFGFGGLMYFFEINLYFGLLIFIGFIFVDTQLMINRFENCQNSDTYAEALNLFIDAVGVFVRILIILMKNKKKNDD